MASLIDSLSEVSLGLVRSLETQLGQPTDSVQKAFEASTTVMLDTIASRSKDQAFLRQVTNIVSASGGGHPANVEAGPVFLWALFGNNKSAAEKKIADAAGMEISSASAVLAGAAPLLLGVLAPKLTSNTLAQVVKEGRALRARSDPNAGKVWLWQVLLLGALLMAALVWHAYRGSS